jgi:putative MATE family efflux protein
MAQPSKIGLDFTQGSIPRLLVNFMGPLLLANILNSIYNTVDMIVIGQFAGSSGTVAVSLGGKMLMFISVVCMGLASGGQILVAQQEGAHQHDRVRFTIGTLFSILGLISVVLCIVCLALSRPIISWLNTPEESVGQALSYLRITSAGLPLLFGYIAVSSILRGMGDSKNPLLFIGIAAVLNLILDIVFIVFFNMGAAGTALATVIAQGISFITSIILLYRRREEIGFDFKLKSFAVDRETAAIIFRLGIPMAVQGGLIQVTQLFMMSFINTFGLVQAAAYGIGDKIIHLLSVVQMSMMQAGGAMAGQNIGAGRQDRVKQTVWTVLGITLAVSVVISLFSLIFPNVVFGLFTKDPEVMKYSFAFMLIVSICLFLSSVQGAFGSVTTGVGAAGLSFLAGFLDGVIFRVAFSFLFGYTLGMEVTGFFLANTIARLGPCIVHCPYYFSGAWKSRKKLVREETP